MCGIAGLAGEDSPARAELVGRMLDAIVHRGPDDGGYRTLPGAVLGNRRLSIIDVAGGRQPIANEDDTIHVVFNGEIYDYKRHRALLESSGHRFATNTDTEILVHRYEDRGLGFLDGLNGMWAVAIHDRRDQTVVLARDRFGKKPLYWTLQDGLLRFASELKALLVDPDLPRRIDLESLRLYLTLECVPSPRSIFEGIHKLAPGHLLVFRDGQASVRRYWDVSFDPEEPVPTFAEAVEIVGAHLDRAVSTRLVADVPVGVFLSGGIDSSTVAYHAARAHPGVKTFSIGFAERSFDETHHARRVARDIGTAHQERILSASDSLALLPRVVDTLDEPFGDASIFPTYLLSSFAREQVTVALGGDGGDEPFLGYPTYLAHRLAGLYGRLPGPLRKLTAGLVGRLPVSMDNLSLDFKLRRFVAGALRPSLTRNAVWLGSLTPEGTKRLLAPPVRSALGSGDGMEFLDRMQTGVIFKDPLERVL
jgi:asparagine synthase (glutamine-hydrolysing)